MTYSIPETYNKNHNRSHLPGDENLTASGRFAGSEKNNIARNDLRQNVIEVGCLTLKDMNSPESSFSSDLTVPPGSGNVK